MKIEGMRTGGMKIEDMIGKNIMVNGMIIKNIKEENRKNVTMMIGMMTSSCFRSEYQREPISVSFFVPSVCPK
jgi:hypothetical protein